MLYAAGVKGDLGCGFEPLEFKQMWRHLTLGREGALAAGVERTLLFSVSHIITNIFKLLPLGRSHSILHALIF